MIVKSYEVQKKTSNLLNLGFFLLYGENFGLKKDIKNLFKNEFSKKDKSIETLTFYEDEILSNNDNFYNFIYSGSLFSSSKIIIINDGTDRITKIINDIYDKYPQNILLIVLSGVLEKKSRLRNFFESNHKAICIPCYSDNEKDLQIIAQRELRKNDISLSIETINLLVEKSNADRANLKNEIDKIKAYSLNRKKIGIEEIKSLINFSGEYKSDTLVNECLCGNISQYKKIISEIYITTINQIFLMRILSIKIQRLLKIKEQDTKDNNIDNLINFSKPAIFWKEKPLVKKQVLIWNLKDLKKMIHEINNTELLCKKNPNLSKIIFINFLSKICRKANSYS